MAKVKKAAKHESKGDALFSKGKFEKALKEYRKALETEPESAEILDKLISAHEKIPGEWRMEDFAESLSWEMKRQEKERPSMRQVHARLSPEWKEATKLAVDILSEGDEEKRGEKIEKLAAMGEIAARAMIGLLLDIKNPPAEGGEHEEENLKP
ncbi:MAG TPA: tetratricopeptide repeat protein [bacterium]|nr:tetratricopeptide repeat protein [bacterium]